MSKQRTSTTDGNGFDKWDVAMSAEAVEAQMEFLRIEAELEAAEECAEALARMMMDDLTVTADNHEAEPRPARMIADNEETPW